MVGVCVCVLVDYKTSAHFTLNHHFSLSSKMTFLLILLISCPMVAAAGNRILFFSEEDLLTSSLQSRAGMPIFTDTDFNWYPVCGDMSLQTAHWICRKQGHARGALSVMRNSASSGRSGVTEAMMKVSGISSAFTSFISNLECSKDATWLGNGCTYTKEATCQFGDETIVKCDAGKIDNLPAASIVADHGDSPQTLPTNQGSVVVQMGDFNRKTGGFTRMTLGFFCADDIKDQAMADKICKLLGLVNATRAVEWKRAGAVTDPKMRLTSRVMDGMALRAVKLGSCDTVETCGLEVDWNLCGPEDSLSIKCE